MPSPPVPPDDFFSSGSVSGQPSKPALPDVDEDHNGDADEYELEAPDEEMLHAARRRAEDDIEVARSAVDIDAIYRESDEQSDLSDLFKGFRFQYQTKHLLILTAVVAVFLTAIQLTGLLPTLLLVILFGLAGIHVYLGWREGKRQQQVERRRRQIYERQRLLRAGRPASELPPLEVAPFEVAQEPPEPAGEAEPFRFSFSRNEVLTTLAIAAVVLGVLYLLPSGIAAVVLGFIALVGLVVHAVGYEPPRIVALGWWMLLVMYVVVSVLTAFQTSAT